MKNYYIFPRDNEYVILEVLQYKEMFFYKEKQRYKTLDLAEKYVTMMYEEGEGAGSPVPVNSVQSGHVKDFSPVMKFGKKRDPNEDPKSLFRRKKPRN